MRAIVVLGLLALVGLAEAEVRRTKWKMVNKFPTVLSEIRSRQAEFRKKWKQADGKERERIREKARRFVVKMITRRIFPPWMGTPWHMGKDDDALMPHQEGKRISCSMFVTAVLQNAGLQLDNRKRWADSRALYIQRSLAPEPEDLHRYFSIPPRELAGKLGKLEDGLYLIGLNCHVGFVIIQNKKVHFVHSNYVDPEEGVVDELLEESQAIMNSQPVGYWITPVFQDDRLIEFWLEGKPVPIRRNFGSS
ncbi:hypothetical protein ACFL2F_01030 [Myxococcota bacterium]